MRRRRANFDSEQRNLKSDNTSDPGDSLLKISNEKGIAVSLLSVLSYRFLAVDFANIQALWLCARTFSGASAGASYVHVY